MPCRSAPRRPEARRPLRLGGRGALPLPPFLFFTPPFLFFSLSLLAWSMFAMTLSVGSMGGGNSRLFATLMVLVPWIVATGISVALVIALYHAIESRIRHLAGQS